MSEKPAKNLKNRKFTAYAAIFAALALAIAIPLNLLANRLNVTWDMTPTKLYELTDTTTDYLAALDKPVKIYFLKELDELKDELAVMSLYRCLKEYDSYENIELIDFDPDSDPSLVQQLQDYGYTLTEGDIVVECEGRTKHVPALNMYLNNVSEDDNGNEIVNSSYFTGENYITGAIDAVVSGRDTVIYFLTGHGEKSLSSDYSTLAGNLSDRNYLTNTLDLSTQDSVPDNAAMVILAAPQYDLSNDETRKLNNYLDNGGNVCFWMSPNKETTRYTNIESIMGDFGIAMDYDIVRETSSDLYFDEEDPYTFRVSLVAADEESGEIDITSGLADLVNSGIRPIMSDTRSFYMLDQPADTSLKYGSLMQTAANTTDDFGNRASTAVGEKYGYIDPDAEENMKEVQVGDTTIRNVVVNNTVLDLAMYSTSTLRSDAKIMVMGNAEFIDDATMQDDTKNSQMIIPVNLMLAVFSWMYDSDLDIDMHIDDKENRHDSMEFASENDANATAVVLAVVPAAVGLIGLGVWLKRRVSG